MYNKIDWEKYLAANVPLFLRKITRMDWLRVLISQVIAGWNRFISFRNDTMYKMRHTGQVIYLEKVLNDRFDSTLRRIEVVDGDWANRLFIYQEHEDQPYWIYQPYDAAKSYVTGDQVQHIHDIYEALVDNPQNPPPNNPTEWVFLKEAVLLKQAVDYIKGDRFYVILPNGLIYNEAEMNSVIHYYRIAPMKWRIIVTS